MPSILITQCLQRDFVGAVSAHDPLPNKLHVGAVESQRLLGPDADGGPIAQLMTWARQQPADRLAVIHVRDWHSAEDPSQTSHLATFGAHCLANTDGATFVFGPALSSEHIVNATGLNDFEGTDLPALLASFSGPLRVGVVGVWTEAKVTFLLYDLKTRLGIEELATCSALTASNSRGQHFNALTQLEKILGVQVFDAIGEFTDWLAGSSAESWTPPPGAAPKGLESFDAADRDLIAYLYRDAARVECSPLGGGFSGALVFRTRAWDALGHELAPSVTKVGPRKLISTERAAFERVEGILGNHAPRVHGFVDLGVRAGIRYAFASMGSGKVQTFKGLFAEPGADAKIEAVLSEVFDEILGRFSAAAQYENLPVLDHYGFKPEFAGSVRRNVERLVGTAVDAPQLTFPGGFSATNLVRFYTEFLPSAVRPPESHYVSYVHGDLNGANILIDARDNVWMIDWFHTARGHVLKDLAKLENDLLFIFTPIENEAELAEGIQLLQALRQVDDLRAELPATPPSSVPALQKAWKILRLLRAKGAERVREDRDPQQLRVALLRYSAHTLSFDESSDLQKRWALAAACGWAEDIAKAAALTGDLRVDWIAESDHRLPGRLGMTLCPGRRDRGRSLDKDLQSLLAQGAQGVVCLLPQSELDLLGVPDLAARCIASGLTFERLAIRDQSVPELAEMRDLVAGLVARLSKGEGIVVFCMGGLGRTGTVAASLLVERGWAPEAAIARVRAIRSPRAVESEEQEAFVRRLDRS